MLCGPVGSGKTSAVYAAAEEFGFKVLEVNPSRKRSGLEVLSQFGEATQSRRIGGGGDEQKKQGAGGIGGFFGKKPAPAAATTSAPAKDTAKKDAKETARNTLILFEEVDVLRGEDRGFMAALAQLIAGAKRPIVLTSNSPSLPSLIDAPLPAGTSGDGLRLARVRFRSPSPADAAVYASLVAAAEGKRVSPGEVASAARLADAGDVRRALLSAQFAASSPAAEMTRRPTRGTTKSRSTAAVAALEYDTDAVAAVAAELIARVDPRVAAAEALAPARATHAMSLVAEASQIEERETERRAEEAAVRRRAEVVAAAAAAKAERAARNDARIEKGPLGSVGGRGGDRRGSLGLVAAGRSAANGDDEDGEEAERAAKVAAAADAARDAYLAEAAARFAERAPGGESPGGEAPETPPDAYPGDDWARALRELDSLASLSASLSAADAMLVPARATVTGPSNGAAERVDVGGWLGGAGGVGRGATAATAAGSTRATTRRRGAVRTWRGNRGTRSAGAGTSRGKHPRASSVSPWTRASEIGSSTVVLLLAGVSAGDPPPRRLARRLPFRSRRSLTGGYPRWASRPRGCASSRSAPGRRARGVTGAGSARRARPTSELFSWRGSFGSRRRARAGSGRRAGGGVVRRRRSTFRSARTWRGSWPRSGRSGLPRETDDEAWA